MSIPFASNKIRTQLTASAALPPALIIVIPISEQTLTSEATAPRLSFSIGLVTLCRLAEVRATYHHKSGMYESILNVSNMITKNLLRSVEVWDLSVWVVGFRKHDIIVGGHMSDWRDAELLVLLSSW